MTLGSFGMRLLYRCAFNVEADTTEEQLSRLIEDALRNEAEMWEWPPYEWIKHKIESEFAEPERKYYLVEVGEKE